MGIASVIVRGPAWFSGFQIFSHEIHTSRKGGCARKGFQNRHGTGNQKLGNVAALLRSSGCSKIAGPDSSTYARGLFAKSRADEYKVVGMGMGMGMDVGAMCVSFNKSSSVLNLKPKNW